jgi:3-oxoacyl-[acyl-carrier-protein] synthase-3
MLKQTLRLWEILLRKLIFNMALFNFKNIQIGGIAAAVPSSVEKTSKYFDTFGEQEVKKFIDQTGIYETRRTSKHQTTSDLGYVAALKILSERKIDPSEIGAVVFASHSPDYRRPSTAFVLQMRLGIPQNAAVFDISLGCSSLIYGVQVLGSMMQNSDIKKALLITGDTAGKSVYPSDRSSVMLFGEAGAALLLEKTFEENPITSILKSDGNGYRYMIVPGGGYRYLDPPKTVFECKDGNKRTLYNSFIQGTAVFTFTIFDVPQLLREFFLATETNVDSYDCFAFHQANLYILKQIAKKVGIPMEKLPLSLHKYGNTSGASPLISLIERYSNVEEKEILNTLFCGFGIGVSLGAFSARVDTKYIYPIIEDDSVFEEGVINSPNELYTGLLK